MKRKIDFLIVALFAVVLFASCERVAPNYAGVLMENYGKQGKEDFKIVAGKVSTWELGTELFQVPLFDQRGEFSDPVTLKAADNTEFTARLIISFSRCGLIAYPGTIMPHLFSSLCKSSRARCIRSTAVDTTKSLFVHVKCLYCRGKRISGEIGRRLVSVVKMHE